MEQKSPQYVAVPVDLMNKIMAYLIEKPIKEAGVLFSECGKCNGVILDKSEEPKVGEQKPKLEEVKNV